MGFLRDFFETRTKRQISKWDCYFDVYERYFTPWRGKSGTFVEIGIQGGGSLQMWREFFGPDMRIIGVDISPDCAQFAEGNTEVMIGDQGDPAFLKQLIHRAGPIDLFLDDGGHTMQQQILTFDMCFPVMRERSVFICEDVHTSYFPPYGGGLREPGSFIEHMKGKIDELNGYHHWGDGVTDFTRSATSIAFFDSMVVVEKAPHPKPRNYVAVGGVVREI